MKLGSFKSKEVSFILGNEASHPSSLSSPHLPVCILPSYPSFLPCIFLLLLKSLNCAFFTEAVQCQRFTALRLKLEADRVSDGCGENSILML